MFAVTYTRKIFGRRVECPHCGYWDCIAPQIENSDGAQIQLCRACNEQFVPVIESTDETPGVLPMLSTLTAFSRSCFD